MIFFQDRTQLLLLPAFGIVWDGESIFFTLSFLYYGISVKLFTRTGPGE